MDDFPKMDAQMNAMYPIFPTQPQEVTISEGEEMISELDEKERSAVIEFSKKINIYDVNQVVNYGLQAQSDLTAFTEEVLDNVKTKDIGDSGELIAQVVTQLNDCQIKPQPRGFRKLFGRAKNYAMTMRTKYDSVSANVEKVAKELRDDSLALKKDLEILEKLYEQNRAYFKELTLYIAAGKLALEEAKKKAELLRQKAMNNSSQALAQEYKDAIESINRFEKKLLDLEITRTISLQMAPQIRMLQSNNFGIIDKINSTIVNTIPLWKQQLIIFLGEENSKKAIAAQKMASDITNEMLRQNAESLHTISVETARELERGIVDIDTLRETNKHLISILDEVSRIQKEGEAKREQTSTELKKIEQELKNKLLSMANNIGDRDDLANDNNSYIEGEPEFRLTL